ncbi:PTS sugar transporter subunit IIB [Leuconostoc rapi]|uniref:PTS sugar transporter subunit IIB n=1 Tax=Leuconostoc rapi TaxID=1406906 RepID=UPI001957E0D7|nr:PTS sugar transporter subunit IIB [Leuconostoc rapi]MBM7435085.1 PTS system cellobiose-specific IIB component [Leuconostoc rapi]
MSKKTIMLCCVAGMSTSLLVNKMKKAADAAGIEVNIFATSVSGFDEEINSKKIDCVLLGPQVSYMENELRDKLGNQDIPLRVISMADYGMMNGQKVLKEAVELMQ